jgi:hypothetical protein
MVQELAQDLQEIERIGNFININNFINSDNEAMEDKSGNLYKQISAQFSSDCEAE